MKTKTSADALNVPKIMADLKEYENSKARGGLKINVPVQEAVRMLAKHKLEPKHAEGKRQREKKSH